MTLVLKISIYRYDSSRFQREVVQKVEIILPNKITLKITLEPNSTINFIKGLLS